MMEALGQSISAITSGSFTPRTERSAVVAVATYRMESAGNISRRSCGLA